jgi:uncharacterized membrane protein YgcG
MRLRIPTTVAVAASTLVLGGVAYAAASSIGTNPAPQTVIDTPSSSSTPASHSVPAKARTSDDPATHDANDDKGGLRSPGVSDDPASHDANDDHGGNRSGSSGSSGSGGSGRSGGSDDSGSGRH